MGGNIVDEKKKATGWTRRLRRLRSTNEKGWWEDGDTDHAKNKKKKKVKKFKVLRVPIPTDEENCKFSDNLADIVRTLCQICEASVTLSGMRRHTRLKHKLQITKYKELHGPFKIIEHVFHKCHLCDKIMLLDRDAMGGHIKGTHKMKEKDYTEQFMFYSTGPDPGRYAETSSAPHH